MAGSKRSRNNVSSFLSLTRQLAECRARYRALVDELSAACRGEEDERAQCTIDYTDLMEDFEHDDFISSEQESPLNGLRVRFRDTVRSVLELRGRIKDTLMARSIRSSADAEVLRTYQQLDFAKHFEPMLRFHPFTMLTSLDAVAELLEGAVHTTKPLRYDPALLVKAIECRGHTADQVAEFFGIKEVSTISRWRKGLINMRPETARRYNRYISVLDEKP